MAVSILRCSSLLLLSPLLGLACSPPSEAQVAAASEASGSKEAERAPQTSAQDAGVSPPEHKTEEPDAAFQRVVRSFDAASAFEGKERVVGLGYIQQGDGSVDEQLVVLELRKPKSITPSSGFHRKIYYPDEICGTAVVAQNTEEQKLIASALDALRAGEQPEDNPAYQWAQEYEFESGFCRPWSEKTAGAANYWEARRTEQGVLFVGLGWEGDLAIAFEATGPGGGSQQKGTEQTGGPSSAAAAAALSPEPQDALAAAGIELQLGARSSWDPPEAFRSDVAASPPAAARWRLSKTIHVGHSHLSHAFLLPDGEHAVALSEAEGAVRYYNTRTGQLKKKLPLPGYEQFSVQDFSVIAPLGSADPQGPGPEVRVLTRTSLYRVRLLDSDISQQSPEGFVHPTGIPGLLARQEDTFRTASRGQGRSTLSLQWQAAEAAPSLALTLSSSSRILKYSLTRDGKVLALCRQGDLLLIDLPTQEARVLASGCRGAGFALSPDASLLGLGSSELQIFSLDSPERAAAVQRPPQLYADAKYDNNLHRVLFTRDGSLVLTSSYDGKARSYARSGASFSSPQLLRHSGTANVYALSLSEDERALLTSSGDRSLKIWRR